MHGTGRPLTSLSAASSNMTSTSRREDVIQSAIKFLKDPKVASSPLAKKIGFLESKGLSAEEIEDAVARSATGAAQISNASTSTSAGNADAGPSAYGQVQPPVVPYYVPRHVPYGPPAQYYTAQQQQQQQQPGSIPPHMMQQQRRLRNTNWKDYFIGAVVAIGTSYGILQLIKTYVTPLVSWPTDQKLELERKRIDEHLASASCAISAVKDETEQVVKAMESQATKVNASLDTMHGILKDLRDLDDKRDVEMRALRDDMDNIKSMIPKMLDKTKETQSNVLTDLQTEIKSLKNLLLNRRLGGSNPPIPPSALPLAGITTNDQNDSVAVVPPSSITATTQAPAGILVSSSAGVHPARPVPVKPAIPSWQLEDAQGNVEKKGVNADGESGNTTA